MAASFSVSPASFLRSLLFVLFLTVVLVWGVDSHIQRVVAQDNAEGLRLTRVVVAMLLGLASVSFHFTRQFWRRLVEEHRQAVASSERLTSVISSFPDALVTTDLRGVILSWNPGAERLIGFGAGEIVGRPLGLVVPPEGQGASTVAFEHVYKMRGSQESEPVPMEALRRDGARVPVELTVGPLRGPESGFVVMLRDVSRVRAAQEALRESEERFRQLAENIREVFWLVDFEQGRVLYVSPAYEEIWGRSVESACRSINSWMEGFHPDDRQRLEADPSGALRGQRQRSEEEFRVVRPDGTVRWVQVRTFPIAGPSGAICRVAGFCTDTTQRKEMELRMLQTEKLAAIGQLAGGVAHELNNPLTAVLVYSDRLKQRLSGMKLQAGAAHADWVRDLERIAEAAKRCEKTVRSLRTFARQGDQQATTVDINEVLRSTLDLLAHKTARVHMQVDLAEGLPVFQGNPVGLQQVLTNLIVNAIDAMPEGGVLSVSSRRSEGCLEVRVSDTGTGISAENLKHLFEPFFTTKAPGKGTGLGLPISRRIIQDHGGTVEVESVVGRGTTFTVSIPLDAAAPVVISPAMASPNQTGGT